MAQSREFLTAWSLIITVYILIALVVFYLISKTSNNIDFNFILSKSFIGGLMLTLIISFIIYPYVFLYFGFEKIIQKEKIYS
jgi:hydrogenase-4 membrane subunit HyfE